MEGHAGSAKPDEWGSAVASGDATKLAELVLVWSGSKPERALSILRDCVSLLEKEVAVSAKSFPPVPPPSTTSGRTSNSCLSAIAVALNETWDGKSWYTSTKELQLASLEFCTACRNYQTLHLNVDSQISRRLLAAADAPPPHPNRLCGTRVPRLRARRATWNMPTAREWREPVFAMTDVDHLEFGDAFRGSLDAVAWPQQLKSIEFRWGSVFDQPIACVEFPPSLQQLGLGQFFNQPIGRVSWPDSLRQLTFAGDFNHSIEGVSWPDSLQRLRFGFRLNQPVDNVRWPASLQELTFGDFVDLGDNQMVMCSTFNQRIDRSAWPASLQQLTLGGDFRQSLQGLGTWMPNLEVLRVLDYDDYEQPDSLLRGIEWPKGLRALTVLGGSTVGDALVPNLDGVEIPSNLQVYRANLEF